ncbi:MAG: DUF938 domain-containing protein [Merismopedia sp. SIO2A8]|nr:DUF938 domain-containing protein [Symploca sp. SIO2B6]NET47493.1 DUF938 domain-containing protein [Merismopedia sp. SIO2A8]
MISPNSNNLRQYAPATQRNRQPILDALKEHLPTTGDIVEVASGTGEHAVFFAPQLAPRRWLPTDINPIALDSIAAWREQIIANESDASSYLHFPILLDVTAERWSIESIPLPESLQQSAFVLDQVRAIAAINMIHIAPWTACEGLMAGAGRILPPGGVLYLYGPFKQQGVHTAPSNEAFDQSLRSRNPEWGVRNLETVTALAEQHGLHQHAVIPMPANNLSVVWRRL